MNGLVSAILSTHFAWIVGKIIIKYIIIIILFTFAIWTGLSNGLSIQFLYIVYNYFRSFWSMIVNGLFMLLFVLKLIFWSIVSLIFGLGKLLACWYLYFKLDNDEYIKRMKKIKQ